MFEPLNLLRNLFITNTAFGEMLGRLTQDKDFSAANAGRDRNSPINFLSYPGRLKHEESLSISQPLENEILQSFSSASALEETCISALAETCRRVQYELCLGCKGNACAGQ